METLSQDQSRLEKSAHLGKAVQDIQDAIDQVRAARNVVADEFASASSSVVKLQGCLKKSFDKVNDNFQEVHKGLNKYGKSLDKRFKDTKPVPFADSNALSSQPSLVNRAVAMHLLREGHFDVASTFISESNAKGPPPAKVATPAQEQQIDSIELTSNNTDKPTINLPPSSPSQSNNIPQPPPSLDFDPRTTDTPAPWASVFPTDSFTDGSSYDPASPSPSNQPYPTAAFYQHPESLKHSFAEMYHILHELRNNRNLTPAISWARHNSALLDARGSNLEFDLCRLQYITLFTNPTAGPAAAIPYARNTFPTFPPRYAAQIRELVGALAYLPNLAESPYASLFASASSDTAADSTYLAAAQAFTSEFCALLSLSSASPLLTTTTAGCIAIPTLQKFSQIQSLHKTSWTTSAELPVEVPLPPAFSFHSIFVCPVSKEQSTDENPPMMLNCGHVLCRGSLKQLGRGERERVKCPYCPVESTVGEASRVYL